MSIPRKVHNLPAAPDGLGPIGKAAWVRLWTAGDWLNPRTQLEPMRILAGLYDELEMYRAQLRAEPMVEGSTGQVRVNPAASAIRAIEGSMRAWMKELGYFAHRTDEQPADAADDEFLFGDSAG